MLAGKAQPKTGFYLINCSTFDFMCYGVSRYTELYLREALKGRTSGKDSLLAFTKAYCRETRQATFWINVSESESKNTARGLHALWLCQREAIWVEDEHSYNKLTGLLQTLQAYRQLKSYDCI